MMSNWQQLFCYACYRVGCAEDAEDILQSVYLRMLERFGPDEDVDNMAAYVYRSLSNACTSSCVSLGWHDHIGTIAVETEGRF